jgi:hypothetical protein
MRGRHPKDDPFVMDVKRTAWKFAVGAVAAFALATVLLEGPVSRQLENRDNELILHRFDSKKVSTALTEDRIRTIVKEEMKDIVKKDDLTPLLQHQLEEIRRMLPPQKPQARRPNTPVPQ